MIYNLTHIRKYLDKDITKDIVHACVTNKMDHCNGLLYGIPDSQINSAIVTGSKHLCKANLWLFQIHTDHPYFKNLHLLPGRQRKIFKILLIVYKALLGQAPTNIEELLNFKLYQHNRNLRSSRNTLVLQIPSIKTKITLGDRAFACAAPNSEITYHWK